MLISSCSSGKSNSQNINQPTNNSQTAENSNSTKDDAEGLAMIVKLPFEPEEAVWREEKAGKSGEGKLTAILQFKPGDAEKITAQAQSYKQPETINFGVESWFPAEVIAQSQLSGDETLNGITYAANDFFQTPYNDGKITRVPESNYFILELYSR